MTLEYLCLQCHNIQGENELLHGELCSYCQSDTLWQREALPEIPAIEPITARVAKFTSPELVHLNEEES